MTVTTPQFHCSSRLFLPISLLLLLALNLSIFLPSMKGNFLWDDKLFISENLDVQSPGFWKRFLLSPFGGMEDFDENSPKANQDRQFYRPLTSLSYWFDFKAWGLNPAAFHLTNILFHFLNCVLLLVLLLELGFGRPASLAGSLLFSVFPVHFENVAWISGRTDLLSFLFAAVSLLFFLTYLKKGTLFRLMTSSFFYLAALLAKENVFLLPVLYFLLLILKRRTIRDGLFSLCSFGLAFLTWAGFRYNALGSTGFQYSGRTLPEFLGTIGFYTWKTAFPFNLSVTIDPSPVFLQPGYQILGLSLLFLAAASAYFVIRRKKPDGRYFLPIPVFFVFLLPSAVVIFSAATISLLAWRFLYMPSVVFIAGISYGLFSKVRRMGVSVAVLILLLTTYAAEIVPKNALFGRDDTNFWLGIDDLHREDLIAKFNTGIKYLPIAESKALRIFEDILNEKRHPLSRMWKRRVHEELAIYYAFQKDFSKAEEHFQELMRSPAGLSLHAAFNYAYYLAFSGRNEEGERMTREKIEAFPQNHFVLTRAAKFYLIVKDYEKALDLYRRDFEFFPSRQTQNLIEGLEALHEEAKKNTPSPRDP